jgi:hypothetical protein
MTCLASAQVCRLRAARLANCNFVTGVATTNAVVSSAVVRVSSTPDYEAGEDFFMKNGCGELCAVLKTCDQLKRLNVEIDMCLRDVRFLELTTGGRLIPGATPLVDPIGFARRAVGAACPNPSSIEVWSKAIDTSGDCGATGQRWWRTVFPKATLTLADYELTNAVATVKLVGYVEPLPAWNRGPFNDWPDTAGLGDSEVEAFVLDTITPPAAACAYIAVPPIA